jgi:hypothetical protein
MIDNYTVRAIPEKNALALLLNGFFMRSEIELAFHLARIESLKLNKGFDALVNIENLKVAHREFKMSINKMKRILTLFGAENLYFLKDYTFIYRLHE